MNSDQFGKKHTLAWQKELVFVLGLFSIFVLPGARVALAQAHQAAQHLVPVESAMVSFIDAHQNQARALLRQVVDINSGTMNLAGVSKVAAIFKQQFDALGFKTEWRDGAAFARAGDLVARYGNRGPKIMLIGHLDTVFAQDSPFQSITRLDATHWRGPGTSDMKGGDIVILQALQALKAAGVLNQMQLWVVLSGDEERRGEPFTLSTKTLLDAGIWADIALGFEDGDGDPHTAVISRRGASDWTLKVSAKPAHSSLIFTAEIGDGAIFEAARILNQMRRTLSVEKDLTFNPGMIIGGTTTTYDHTTASGQAFGKDNVIAKTLLITGDIRARSPEQEQRARVTLQALAKHNLPHTRAQFEFAPGYPPMAPSAGNRQLLKRYSRVSIDLGLGQVRAVDPRHAGAADISFVAAHVKMALDGLGLMGAGGHTQRETADMATFASQTKRAALLLYRIAHRKGSN